jgi:glyoxylase-like metal-dependent hydrolase (beta-lactamase superfamily II)
MADIHTDTRTDIHIDPLFFGLAGVSSRGYLGWSSCVLLTINGTSVLFDTCGYNERAELVKRLTERQLTPADIDVVILSHIHFDHAVNIGLFAEAAVYVHELDLAHAHDNFKRDLAVPVEILSMLDARENVHVLTGKSGTCAGINWFLAPGHTPGLIALEITNAQGCVVLASDAVKNLESLTLGTIQNTWDETATKQTFEEVAARATHVLPGHDGWLERTPAGFHRVDTPTVSIHTQQQAWHIHV